MQATAKGFGHSQETAAALSAGDLKAAGPGTRCSLSLGLLTLGGMGLGGGTE